MMYIVALSCNNDLKTEAVNRQNWFYPVTTGCKGTKSVCDIIKISPTNNCSKKIKRNFISHMDKRFKSLKRKHKCTQQTTCTPFFICRSTIKKQVPSFKYVIPPSSSESLFTKEGLPIESIKTKSGKLKNFFFPKLSSQQLEFESNNYTNGTSESVTVVGWKHKEGSNTNSTMEKNLNNNGSKYSFVEMANNITAVNETKADHVSTTKLNVEVIFPTMEFDMGLCSGQPKNFMKETTKKLLITNLSLPFNKQNLKSEYQSENQVATNNFLQKFKLKMLTVSGLKQITQTGDVNSLSTQSNNPTTFKGEDYFIEQLSQRSKEKVPATVMRAADSTFYPYTKFKVKDLFNFKNRPPSEKYHVKPSSLLSRTKTLNRNSASSRTSTEGENDNSGGKSARSTQTSKNLKPLPTNTESDNIEELEPVIVNTSCECSLDADLPINDKTSEVCIQSNPPELDVTEALSPEVETVTLHSFVNLKNLFNLKKLNTIPNKDGENLSYTESLLHQPLWNNNHNQRSSNNGIHPNSTSSNKNSLLFSNVPLPEIKLLDTFSLNKPPALTTPNTGFNQILFTNISPFEKQSKRNPLQWTTHEPNKSTTSKRDFFNLKSVLHLQNKNKPELLPDYSDANRTEYPLSTAVNAFEPKICPPSNAYETLVDMNPEQFYQEFEKSTKSVSDSSSVLAKKQKLNFKHVLSFLKQTSSSHTTDQSQTDSEDSKYFNTDLIKLKSFQYAKTKLEEEFGHYTSTQSSNNITFRFNFKIPLTKSKPFQEMKMEDSVEPMQKSSSQLSPGSTLPVIFSSSEEGTGSSVKENNLDECTSSYSVIPSLEDGMAKKLFKLKSVFRLHKPISSNNTKLCQIFDPGGVLTSEHVTLQEQRVETKLLNSFEQSTNVSTREYCTETQQSHFTVNTEYATKPAGWWLFWNQPKVTFDKFVKPKNRPDQCFGITNSVMLPILLNTTVTSACVSDSSFLNQSTRVFLQNSERKGTGYLNMKKVQKYMLGKRKSLKTSTPDMLYSFAHSLNPVSKNKQIVHNKEVNISISKLDAIETKNNQTIPYNILSKNIHSSGLDKKNKVFKPFEKVVHTPQPYGQGNISELDAKNLSYFIQNLTLNSNNTLTGGSKPIILNSNIRQDSLKSKILNKTASDTNNMTSANDSSFSIMAYVLRPFESLVSVFKGKSTENMTKVGDVSASDIHNGSIPPHLHPLNSSLVILALNNTNTTSKETHESKVGLFDMLGGWFHCIVETYVEPNPRDIHFYLFTRNSINTPEELFLTEEKAEGGQEENTTDIPTPVWETQSSPESERKKRQTDDEDNNFEPLSFATSELESKWFNLLDETKVLIHGYIQDYQTDIIVNMKDEYLKKGAFNVIVVDWSSVGDNTCYPSVAEHGLISVGRLLSRLLDQLVTGGVSLSRVHVVGFSLGAHVAGIAGTITGGLLSRITGLDPALPYVPMDPDICLDAGDAMFVDIIHSAAGYLGQPGPTGHADFYPNGGSQQPGCDLASLGACSHRRSALYFIESINSETGFRATLCDNWHDFQTGRCNATTGMDVLAGDPCPTNAKGKYFLRTGPKEPFAVLTEEHSKVKKSLLLDIFYELV